MSLVYHSLSLCEGKRKSVTHRPNDQRRRIVLGRTDNPEPSVGPRGEFGTLGVTTGVDGGRVG